MGAKLRNFGKCFFQSSDWLSGYWMSVAIVCPPQIVDNNRLASSSQNGTYDICWYFAVAYDKTVTHLRLLNKLTLEKNSPLRVSIDSNRSDRRSIPVLGNSVARSDTSGFTTG